MKDKLLYGNSILIGEELHPLENGCIILRDGQIHRITTRDKLDEERMSQYEVIDLSNMTLMPGLIECHNHLAMDARLPRHLEMMENSECELSILAVQGLKDDLISGVTTARCMGDRHYIDVIFKREIDKGNMIGPDLLVAGIGMRSIHGHGYVGLPHSGVDEFRKRACENLMHGVDFLKIFATAGAPPMEGDFIPHYLTRDEIIAVVEAAKSVNKKVAAHCIGGQALIDCLECGVQIIEHAYCATLEEMELIKKYDCWVDLTSGIFLDPEREQFCPPNNVLNIRKNREYVRSCLENVIKSGVKFCIGTDAYHSLLYKEVEYAVSLGADIKLALKAVTSNAAIMCDIADKTGCLKEGLQADIIGITGNPLLNPNALKNIKFVMKKGKIYRNDN